MQHTSFRPIESAQFNPAVVPTEIDRKHRNRMLWGEGTSYVANSNIVDETDIVKGRTFGM